MHDITDQDILQQVTTARANLRLVEAALGGASVATPDHDFIMGMLETARTAANKAESAFRTRRR